ncbi:LptE family protein [Pedobacter sp. Du54]|uniref:LptE family protein n=1 Tax=Pedobacter anseongensis TaxID=3133439 RepID=UPI0030A27C0E
MKKLPIALFVLILSSCSYKFNGASIPNEMKTVSVPLFENVAALVDPPLANKLTDAFKERIRTQSKLNIIVSGAQGKFEGKILDYDVKPISIQDNTKPVAGANRLTITVEITYTNYVKGYENQGFSKQTFTAFTDFSLAGQPFAPQQEALNKKVIDQLTENIFNRAFAQW